MHTSWYQNGEDISYPRLEQDTTADVVIVGGGLAGMLTAYTLSRSGKSVILLEKDILGGGATMLTTAFLTQAIDTGLPDLIAMYGLEGARLVWQSGIDAIAQLKHIVRDQSLDCELVPCSARVYARTNAEYDALREESTAARRLGFPTTLLRDDALHFPNAGYLELPNQAKFHPLRFLRLLAAHLAKQGVRIHEQTSVAAVSEHGPVKVTTASGHTVTAADVVVTTYLPFNNPRQTHFKKGKYRSYVLEIHRPRSDIPEGIYWDLYRPYHYFRIDREGADDRIIVGGADHRQELPVSARKSFDAVERFIRGVIGTASYHVDRRWSGPIIESSDGLPLIGAYAPHRYVATAFSGNGMTYAMVGAMLFRDLLSGADTPWKKLYDPKRSILKPRRLMIKGRDYLQEFFGGAVRTTFGI
jgi:glycine/D-amino acid oxidase-like deaminating enzyme